MNTSKKDTRFFAITGALAVIISVLFYYIAAEYIYSQNLRIILIILFTAILLLAGLWFIYLRKKVSAFSNDISESIERMINNEDVLTPAFTDTLTARIQEKLKQFYEIMLSSKAESLETKKEIQGIVSDISHQVKTPIANVKMFNEILQSRTVTPEKQKEFLGMMEKQINKLDFLMDAMIKMSRLETGILNLTEENTSIIQTIAKALEIIWPKAELKNIVIKVDCDEHITAKHDIKWTSEAIFNILDNAVKYSPSGSDIQISVHPWQFYTRIDISDQGKGIEEKRYNEIFKRFYREPEVIYEEGVGLGLYLARENYYPAKRIYKCKIQTWKGVNFFYTFIKLKIIKRNPNHDYCGNKRFN